MFGFGTRKADKKIENMRETMNRHLHELGSLTKQYESQDPIIEGIAKKHGLSLENLNSWNAAKMSAEWDRVPNLEDRVALVRATKAKIEAYMKLQELKEAVLAMQPAVHAASEEARQRVVAKYGEGAAAIVEAVAEATSGTETKEIIRKGANGE